MTKEMQKHLEFFEKRHRYCICVFVLSEGERIKKQLQKMASYKAKVDIIIADGGSDDGSIEHDFFEQNGVRTLLVLDTPPQERGLSSQMRMAFGYAIEQGYEGVITMDGNNKDDPKAIPDFIDALDDGYDHVQGSRFLRGGSHANTPFWRLMGIRFIHAPLMSLAARFCYTDTTNGFRAYSAKFLKNPDVKPLRDIFTKYELHYYLAIRAPRLGLQTKEIPVAREYPKHGVPTKIHGIKSKWLIIKTLVNACLGKYNPR